MSEKLKVLFVEPPLARRVGGIETALQGLEIALPAAGVQIVRTEDADRNQLPDFDVVHFHGLWEWSHHRARNWCQQLKKPYLVSPHGMLEDWAFRHRGWKKRPYFHLLERSSVARAAAILATSELETTPLLRWFPTKSIRVLPLGGHAPSKVNSHAQARAKLNIRDDEYVVLFLSRCHEKKGLHVLTESLPEAAKEASRPIRLIVVGDGDARYVDPLRAATASWTGSLRCEWTGAKWGDEKWDYLSAADLLCLPSFSENFGLAVLEALFAGTPVLTTKSTPWPALRGSLPIFFTEPTATELAAALSARIAAGPVDGQQRSATIAEATRTFNWSTLAPRYAELYSEVADSA